MLQEKAAGRESQKAHAKTQRESKMLGELDKGQRH